jgi:predicted Zn-dependent peptidase
VQLTSHSSRLIDDSYVSARLPCGLSALVFPKRGMQRKLAVYGTLYGSIDNEFRDNGARHSMPHGIAHFLEHQLFKKESGDLLVEFSKKGASSNAGTEYSTTVYFFTCISGFEDNLATLTDLVFRPCFRDDWVEKEKLIIEQELRMYRDMPDVRILQNLHEALWSAHPARVDIGGTVESIRRITRGQLEQCWKTFYNPGNMVLVVAGDVDPPAILDAVQRRVAALGLLPAGRLRRFYPREPREVAGGRRREAMQVGRPKFLIAWKETDLLPPGRGALEREIAVNLALEAMVGRGSALYSKLYAKGLIDESFSAHHSCARSFGSTTMGGETDDPEALEAALLEGMRRFLREGLRGRDLDRLRRRYLGAFLRSFDSVEQCGFALLRFWFKRFDVFDVPALVRHLGASAVMSAARRHLRADNRAVSVVTPR